MADGLKSSFELAMERLRAREGREGGEGAGASLTDAQKDEIAKVRAEFKARRAELEFAHRGSVAKATEKGDEERLAQLAAEWEREVAGLAAKEEAAVRAIRGD